MSDIGTVKKDLYNDYCKIEEERVRTLSWRRETVLVEGQQSPASAGSGQGSDFNEDYR
jgi:hypothetical protein